MNLVVDLNADLGEGAGFDEEILSLVTSANIACGFHAGDPQSIFDSIRAAHDRGVAVGAHPSLNDRVNFGRTENETDAGEVFALVAYQLGAFQALAHAAGAEVRHIKPHGALYNMASRNRALADAITHAVLAVDRKLILFAPADSALAHAAAELNLQVLYEVFADRNYMPDGALVPRSRPDALLDDPVAAAERIIRMLVEGKVSAINGVDIPVQPETVCVHGDAPQAVTFVRALRARLELEDVMIAAPGQNP